MTVDCWICRSVLQKHLDNSDDTCLKNEQKIPRTKSFRLCVFDWLLGCKSPIRPVDEDRPVVGADVSEKMDELLGPQFEEHALEYGTGPEKAPLYEDIDEDLPLREGVPLRCPTVQRDGRHLWRDLTTDTLLNMTVTLASVKELNSKQQSSPHCRELVMIGPMGNLMFHMGTDSVAGGEVQVQKENMYFERYDEDGQLKRGQQRAATLSEMQSVLVQLLIGNVFVVGVGITETLMAMKINLPKSQVIDLATEPVLKTAVRRILYANYFDDMGRPNNLCPPGLAY